MRAIIYILILIFTLGCTNSKKPEKTEQEEKLIIKYSNPAQILKLEKAKLEKDYFKLFEFVRNRIGELKFKILDTKHLNYKGIEYWGFKIAAEGSPDWSYAEKFVIVSNTGKFLYEVDFRQIEKELKIPECGVPNYDLDSLSIINVAKTDFLTASIKEHYDPCGGQPEIETQKLLFYSLKNSDLIDSIELFYSMSDFNNKERRMSELKIEANTIKLQRSEYKSGKVHSTENLVYKVIDGKLIKDK
ncbi:MAG: hypothetical protein ACEPOW_14710 [Bacteroidales bacterium]|jgi:hypothetical protein